MDDLHPRVQLTLKVASVVGMVLPMGLLLSIHPSVGGREMLLQDLRTLQAADFVQPMGAANFVQPMGMGEGQWVGEGEEGDHGVLVL